MGIPGSNGSFGSPAALALTLWVVWVLGLMEAFWSRSDDWTRIRSSSVRLEGAEGCWGDPRACSWSDDGCSCCSEARGDDGLKREDARLEPRCLRRVAKVRLCCCRFELFWAAEGSSRAESDVSVLAMIDGRQWGRIPRLTAAAAGTKRSIIFVARQSKNEHESSSSRRYDGQTTQEQAECTFPSVRLAAARR